MCTEVYNLFGDPKCQHKEFQNTFPCHIARRCRADDDQLLNEPVFVPTKPPSVPPGLFGCKVSKATRPITGKCRDCSRQQRKSTPTKTVNGSNYPTTPPSTTSSVKSIGSAASRFLSPPLDSRALAHVHDSFLEISKK
ncbi:hypothetical protein F5Y07DRAFT_360658 [Xylaria sp. FL0933]|nr:hypothetical protein F5Y07DRAFT_360658 [Xylaria sp. FL0933]